MHELSLSASKTMRLLQADLRKAGVDFKRYGERNYEVTQRIGAAINFLGADGLIAPSARWRCYNLVIFAENHSLAEKLEVRRSKQVDWQAWWRRNSALTDPIFE